MYYMDFLNKQAELAKLYQNGQTPDLSSLESNNTGEAGSLFGEQLSAVPKGDGSSVFNVASKEDLQNLNYEQLVSKEQPEESNATTSILRNFLSFEAVRKTADKDGDGEVSAEEAKEYIAELAAKDGDGETLSLEDFNQVINENDIDLQAVLEEEILQLEDAAGNSNNEVSPVMPDATAPSVDNGLAPDNSGASVSNGGTGGAVISDNSGNTTRLINGYSGGASISGGHSSSGYSGGASISGGHSSSGYSGRSQVPANPLDSMSLEQLESEKATRQTTLQEKQTALNAVNNGSNEKVQSAVAEKQQAETAYKEAVKNDENISKSVNKELEKNLKKINENQAKLDEYAVKINDKEVEISSQEEVISSLTSEISALSSQYESFNRQLSSLQNSLASIGSPTGKSEDADKDAKIKAKKKELSGKISAKNAEIKENQRTSAAKKKDLESANKKLDNYKKDLEKLNTEKSKLDEVKTTLNEEKTAIEAKISANCSSETKAKMEAYNKAVQNVDNVKSSELSTAKTALTEAQSALTEVNTRINEVKNRQKYKSGEINTDNIPAQYRDQTSMKTLPNGTQVLTLGYTNYKGLRPEIQDQVALFNEVAAEKGYTFIMSDGFRSIAESNAARARKGNMVAPGGKSPHNYGAAFDCGVYKAGGQGLSRAEWEDFSSEIKKRSNNQIAWGGDFKSKSYEVWHFELPDWKKYKTA